MDPRLTTNVILRSNFLHHLLVPLVGKHLDDARHLQLPFGRRMGTRTKLYHHFRHLHSLLAASVLDSRNHHRQTIKRIRRRIWSSNKKTTTKSNASYEWGNWLDGAPRQKGVLFMLLIQQAHLANLGFYWMVIIRACFYRSICCQPHLQAIAPNGSREGRTWRASYKVNVFVVMSHIR